MKFKDKFLSYLRLLRPPSAGSTGIIVIIGYLIMNGSIDLRNFLILFTIGIFSHIFIFVLNDYIDVGVDEKSQFLKDKPLVSGVINKNHALFTVIISGILSFVLVIFFYRSIYALFFLSLALLSGVIYDIWGKIIPASDIFISSGCAFGCLFGASVVSIQFTNLVYIISFSVFIFLIFCNAVVGGLKDADHDTLAGAKTTATRMGVKVENGKMFIPMKFKLFAFGLDLFFLFLILLAMMQPEIGLWPSDNYIILGIITFLITVILFSLYKFLTYCKFKRTPLYRLFMLNGTATYILVPILLYQLVGLYIMLVLLILPVAWLIIWNLILHGTAVQPKA